MKKVLVFALILAMSLILCACGSVEIELSIPADSVSQTSLTYQLDVKGNGEFLNDPLNFYLERNVGGAWVKVDDWVVVAEPETYSASDGLSYRYTIDLLPLYGELPGGLYKFTKIVTINGEDVRLTADFQIITGGE